MLSLLGLDRAVVVLNKMDLVDFSEDHFNTVRGQVQEWLETIGIEATVCIPISAIKGDNIAVKSKKMGWYTGPTFLESLDTLQNKQPPEDKPMLFPVQDVYKIGDKRINVGRVESGAIEEGAEIKILPSGRTTKINSIEKFLEDTDKAVAGECIGLTTADSVFLDRGNVLCLPGAEPALTDRICANIFWMARNDFNKDRKLNIRCATQETASPSAISMLRR